MAAAVEQEEADLADGEDAGQQGDQADVNAHVAIEDVAEFVAHNALEFVTGQLG